jgi:hypothetical protein
VVYLHWSRQAVFSLLQASSLTFQQRGASLRPLLQKKERLFLKISLRHWQQLLNLFIAPLPTAVCSKKNAADRAVCAICN